jgi:hypothetical protein
MGERITKALYKVEEKKKKRAERKAQVNKKKTIYFWYVTHLSSI